MEQHKWPVSIIKRLHLFTKAIDQVPIKREKALHLESVLGFVLEYLHGEKKYCEVMMEYSNIVQWKISAAPLCKRSKALISAIKVSCIIVDYKNFTIHLNEQIDHLMERTLLARLKAMADANLTELRMLLCITTKHKALIVKRMVEKDWDSDVAFEVIDYESIGNKQRPLSKVAKHQTWLCL